jgi:hypothetical protein
MKEHHSRGRAITRARNNRTSVAKQWSARKFRQDSLTGPVSIEFSFPTADDTTSRLCVSHSELRHSRALIDKFCDRMALFPKTVGDADKDRIEFLTELVNNDSAPIGFIPQQPGFIDRDSFATFTHVLKSDGSRQEIKRPESTIGPRLQDIKGSAAGSRKNVLGPARRSSFLAFGIGVALASPLPSYLRLNPVDDTDDARTLTETAIFNFSGPSGAGKTSIEMAAQSLVGDPNRAGIANFTERGLAEHAAANNDMITVIDDTERNLKNFTEFVRLAIHGLREDDQR